MKSLEKNKKLIISVIISVLVVAYIVFIYVQDGNIFMDKGEDEIINETTEDEDFQMLKANNTNMESEQTKEEKSEIIVHISGAVQTEGIIFLEEGARVSNAIEKAGGTKENADLSKINLAFLLEDGMKIYIPSIGEEIEETDNTQMYIESGNSSKKTDTNVETKSEIININTAQEADLVKLPGIGESTAKKIIAYRNENGKFNNIEEIKNISGIGDSKFNAIKDLIKVK